MFLEETYIEVFTFHPIKSCNSFAMLVYASNIQGAYSKLKTPRCHFQYNKPSRKQMNKTET